MADTMTAPAIGKHGATRLPAVEVDSYNIELKDDEGFLGDRASRQGVPRHPGELAQAAAQARRRPVRRHAFRRSQPLQARRGAEGGRPRGGRRDPERDRGVRAGARARRPALPQGEGLGRHRAHRDGRRLSRQPDRRACDRARQPHPQGGRHQDRHGADPQRPRRGRADRQPASCARVDLQGTRQHPGGRYRRHQHPRRRRAAESSPRRATSPRPRSGNPRNGATPTRRSSTARRRSTN